jgi:hypothetical protein
MARKKRRKYWRKYWRNKADKLLTKICSGRPCAVCKSEGKVNTYQTCGHHLIPRGHSFSRHDLWNIVIICPEHHKFSNKLAAHSDNYFAQKNFEDWIRAWMPKHYLYWIQNQHKVGKKMDYEIIYEKLQGYLDNPSFGEEILYETNYLWQKIEGRERRARTSLTATIFLFL